MVMLDKVRERADDFDILHFHLDYLHFPLFRSKLERTVTTLHGREDLADHMRFYRRFQDMPLVSISNAQRTPLPGANFVGTVHHGLPLELYEPNLGIEWPLSGVSWPHLAGETARPRHRPSRAPRAFR
jgi:hypothetical protein